LPVCASSMWDPEKICLTSPHLGDLLLFLCDPLCETVFLVWAVIAALPLLLSRRS